MLINSEYPAGSIIPFQPGFRISGTMHFVVLVVFSSYIGQLQLLIKSLGGMRNLVGLSERRKNFEGIHTVQSKGRTEFRR